MDLDLTTSAYHEAGHVLLAHWLGGEVVRTTLESEREGHAGHTVVAWRGLDESERARRSAIVALAGPAAEVLWRGEELLEEDLSGWTADWAEVDAGLERLAPPAMRDDLRRRWLAQIHQALESPESWECLCRIADALEAHATLERDLLEELLP